MRETREIIKSLNDLANDNDRVEAIINEPSHGNELSLIREFVEERPQDIPELLRTLATPQARSYVMTFHDKKGQRPLDALSEKNAQYAQYVQYVPAVLKCITADDRLRYIRTDESGAKEYGDITNPQFKCINYIIYCDLYLEHLIASQDSQYSPTLTDEKIKAIEAARAILTDQPESEDTIQQFYNHLLDIQELLATRRDTRLTSFLKSVGLEFLVTLAYNSFFVKTDGKKFIEKIEAIDRQPTKPL